MLTQLLRMPEIIRCHCHVRLFCTSERTTDYEASHSSAKIESVSVRISAGNGVAYHTSPFRVVQLGGRATVAPQWREGEGRLRIDRGIGCLTCHVLARVDRPSRGGGSGDGRERGSITPSAASDVAIATSCIDLATARDGYNYVSMFSPEPDGGEDLDVGVHGQAATRMGRLLGQLIVRLNWIEGGVGVLLGEAVGYATLVVHGASGLASSKR